MFVNVPSVIINLMKQSGKASILAQPQLRITEGEKASLHLGDRVPIPVTSLKTGNTIGGNSAPCRSRPSSTRTSASRSTSSRGSTTIAR